MPAAHHENRDQTEEPENPKANEQQAVAAERGRLTRLELMRLDLARRLIERGVEMERLNALLARQMPDAEKRRRADFVVDSSQGIEHARAQVRQILKAVAKMPLRRS